MATSVNCTQQEADAATELAKAKIDSHRAHVIKHGAGIYLLIANEKRSTCVGPFKLSVPEQRTQLLVQLNQLGWSTVLAEKAKKRLLESQTDNDVTVMCTVRIASKTHHLSARTTMY